MIRAFVLIHPPAIDGPELSLIQISEVAIGRNVFQIGDKCAVCRVEATSRTTTGAPEISTSVASGPPV
jgi:hypothetical protein